jgi:GntR family transcriptional regulator
MVNYVQAMQRRNIATASQLLEFSEMVASRRLAEILKIEIGNPIYRVSLLRFANRVPVILERGFFPCARFPKLEDWDLEKSSTLDLLTSVYQIKPGLISQTVEAVAAAETVAQQLRVEEGFPLIMLSRIIFSNETKTPVVFSQDFLRSDYTRLHTDVGLETSQDQNRENVLGKEVAEPSQES